MRLSQALIWTASAVLLAGCSMIGSPIPEGGKPVRDVYDDMNGQPDRPPIALSPFAEPGAPARTRPVIFPPKVYAVFVQEHLDPERDLKVGSHWVYFKLRDSSWFEQSIDREPAPSVPLEEGLDLRPLKSVLGGDAFSQALIPYQAGADPVPPKEEPRKSTRPDFEFMNGAKEVKR